VTSERAPSSNKLTLAFGAAAIALGAVAYRFVPAMQEAGSWAMVTVAAGAYAVLMATLSLLSRQGGRALAIQAALMAAATMAAGAAGTAAGRRVADEQARYVETTLMALDRDDEIAAINTGYVRASGYAAARRCARLALGPGVAAMAMAWVALRRAGRRNAKDKASIAGMALSAGPAALGLVLAALMERAPVPAIEDPEVAQIKLMQGRFATGDLSGACRILERELQVTMQASEQAVAARVPDVRQKAAQCVELEVGQARKLGASGCEIARELLAGKRFVQMAPQGQEQVAGACNGL
jgi:hypothetical protein